MATLSSKLVISLMDRASGPAKRIAASLGTMKAAGSGIAGVGAAVQKTTRKMQRNAATASTGLAAPSALMGGIMMRNAYKFDKSLRMIAATGEMTENQVATLQERIASLAKIYPKTRQEIAKGALEFITAGNTPEATVAALEDLTRGAIASNQSVGKTGADVTDVLAAYYGKISDPGTYAKRAREVLDLLSVGASSANQTWGEQTLAMQYATPVARALGIPLQNLVAMIGTLADNGFKGEKGGSALRTMLIRLRKPTKEARAALKELGIDYKAAFQFSHTKALDGTLLQGHIESFFGAQGSGVSEAIQSFMQGKDHIANVDVFRERLIAMLANAMNIKPGDAGMDNLITAVDGHLATALDNFKADQVFEKLNEANLAQQAAIFGVRRSPQAIALAKGWEIYTDKLAKINELSFGATERRMKIFMQGFSGAVDKLISKLDYLSNAVEKSGLLEDLVELIGHAGDTVDRMSEAAPGLLRFGGAALLTLGVLGPLGMLLSGTAAGIATVGGAAKLAGLSLVAMSRVSLVGLAAAPLVAGWTALSGAIGRARLQHKLMTMEMAAGNLTRAGALGAMIAPWTRLNGVLGGVVRGVRFLGRLTLIGAAIAGAATFIYNNWRGLGEFFIGIGNGFMAALGPARPVIEGIGAALGKIFGWISKILGPLDESGEKWRSWGEAVGGALALPFKVLGKIVQWTGELAASIGQLFGLEAPGWLKWLFGGDEKQKAKIPTSAALVQRAAAGPKTAEVAKNSSRIIPASAKMRQAQADSDATVAAVRTAKTEIETIANSVNLTRSGAKIMTSLARGMRSNIDAPVSAMHEAATRIRNHVPHSPAKEGPLRGIHRHGLMGEIARSMTPSPMVDAMRRATAAVAAIGAPSASMTAPAHRGGGAGRAVAPTNVSVTVHAQTNASADDIARLAGERVRQAVQDQIGDGGMT